MALVCPHAPVSAVRCVFEKAPGSGVVELARPWPEVTLPGSSLRTKQPAGPLGVGGSFRAAVRSRQSISACRPGPRSGPAVHPQAIPAVLRTGSRTGRWRPSHDGGHRPALTGVMIDPRVCQGMSVSSRVAVVERRMVNYFAAGATGVYRRHLFIPDRSTPGHCDAVPSGRIRSRRQRGTELSRPLRVGCSLQGLAEPADPAESKTR
jgi:hypothetical protein